MKTKKKYNRILQISEDAQQITLPDARYYKRNGEYYPSITYVLGYYPKGKHFEEVATQLAYQNKRLGAWVTGSYGTHEKKIQIGTRIRFGKGYQPKTIHQKQKTIPRTGKKRR